MDFFQAQDTARRNTRRLLVLFTLAVLSLIVITNLLVMLVFGFMRQGRQGTNLDAFVVEYDWQVFVLVGVIVTLVILAGSAYKTMSLAAGGRAVAESLGGRMINLNTRNLHERKALNVVEEMAIASGTPVPQVYLLEDEAGINAFAAGFTPGDAVIGLTRGTIEYLNREELQGVVAHEFSHILHGDMRLNMRLIGILHGILLIGLIGYYILRSVRGRSSKNSGGIVVLGLGLLVIGYSGTFFGNLIKASVSRQREFLADASAVQFTRSRDGIAGALKKIGGFAFGSELQTAAAPSMSHAYFSNGVSSFLQSIFATHPPLAVRIKRVDPYWDGEFVTVTEEVREDEPVTGPAATPAAATMKGAVSGAIIAGQILDSVGQSSVQQLDYATGLVNAIPAGIRTALHEPRGACAVIYCLLIDGKRPDVRDRQLRQLQEGGDSGVYDLVSQLYAPVQALPVRFRLPLIELALPALRELAEDRYTLFKQALHDLVHADRRVDMFEWSLQKILFHHLAPQFDHPGTRVAHPVSLAKVKQHVEVLLGMLAHACIEDRSTIPEALAGAARELGIGELALLPREQINIESLDTAVDRLARLKPLLKPRLLKACLAVITHDEQYSPNEMELMRAIGAVLDCPLPPYLGPGD